jgi:ABC-type dipeptide/oligopeptide/nickel transport system permease component
LILRRVLWTVPVLVFVMLVAFALMRGAGGSPFRLETGGVPLALQQQLTSHYHLDEPWVVEFAHYAWNVFTLDFGPSLTVRDLTVDHVVEQQLPVSIELALWASLVAVPLGLALGLVGALRRRTAADLSTSALSTLFLVAPVFLLAEAGRRYLVDEWNVVETGWSGWQTKVVPALVLAVGPTGYLARIVRAAAVETAQQDYVRVARAKGLRPFRVATAHILRNSVSPALAAAMPLLALLVTGAFFVETAFEVPGAAQWFVTAAKNRDYPMVMGLTVALAALVLLANLVADVAAALLDPRLRERR